MSTDFEPTMVHQIDDLETMKVLSDPIRVDIVHHVMHEARTVKQVAEILKMQPHKLYYHMGLLEKHGLVTLVLTTSERGYTEKFYRAVAYAYQLAPQLLMPNSDGESGVGLLAQTIFTEVITAFNSSVQAGLIAEAKQKGKAPLVLSRRIAMLTRAEQEEFAKRLSELMIEFTSRSTTDGDEARHATLLFGTFETLTTQSEDEGELYD